MIERSPERDAALEAMLPHVPFEGWGIPALRHALHDLGANPEDATLLFPGGVPEMIAAFSDLTDRRMAAEAATQDLAALRTGARVRALVALRLRLLAPHKEAVRRGLAALALPFGPFGRAPTAARCTARTADAIWHAAGDTSADFNWYTKRALLAAVLASTTLFWLAQHDEDDAATLAFLDRRLAGVAAFGKLRGRCDGLLSRLRPSREAA